MSAPVEQAEVWQDRWPANATARIRFSDGVAFYNGVNDNGWVGVNLAGELIRDANTFAKHPGVFDAIFVAYHVHTLEGVLDIIWKRYGDCQPRIEFKAREEA